MIPRFAIYRWYWHSRRWLHWVDIEDVGRAVAWCESMNRKIGPGLYNFQYCVKCEHMK